ncbi:MAG: hypothetical protein KatS3mg104_0070 [Phycisphaerae bacterium]|jgi:serine/threonine protein kinase|nr:MAG: hypothetical protein KatS3mg104_0070 [Phycisphaerae bacterium]
MQLTPGVTWKSVDETGQMVVYKRLSEDCCQKGQLHPSIRTRLQKLREVPANSMVNLIGVLRNDLGVVLVREYVPGTSLDLLNPLERNRAFEAVCHAVSQLHQHGLVHGSLKPTNVIVQEDNTIKLVDPSPFLYDDPQVDWQALAKMYPDRVSSTESSVSDRWRLEDKRSRAWMIRTIGIWIGIGFMVLVGGIWYAYHR